MGLHIKTPKEIADDIRDALKRAADAAHNAAILAQDAAKIAAKKADDLAKEAAKKGTDAIKKAASEAKKVADAVKKDAEKKIALAKAAGKQVKKKMKDLVGKARAAYKKMLRKRILAASYVLIRANGHGIAARLYPAIVSPSDIKAKKIKASFVPKAKKTYDEVLSHWTAMGGKKSKLDEAILKGGKLRIFKPKKSAYSSSFNATRVGLNAPSIYSHIAENTALDSLQVVENRKQKEEFLTENALPFPNNTMFSEYYSGCCGFSGIDADKDGFDDETGLTVGIPETQDVSDEELTQDEIDAATEEGVSDADETEKQSGFKAFIAKIIALFKKHKGDENPYEEGTTDAALYGSDLIADKLNLPPVDSEGNVIVDALDKSKVDPKEADNAVLDGVNKPLLIAGGLIAVGLIGWGVYLLINRGKKG